MKTYRNLFAWLMTIIMLVGMVPVASVGAVNCKMSGMAANGSEVSRRTVGTGSRRHTPARSARL